MTSNLKEELKKEFNSFFSKKATPHFFTFYAITGCILIFLTILSILKVDNEGVEEISKKFDKLDIKFCSKMDSLRNVVSEYNLDLLVTYKDIFKEKLRENALEEEQSNLNKNIEKKIMEKIKKIDEVLNGKRKSNRNKRSK